MQDFLNSMTSEQREEIQDKLAEIVYNYTYDIMSKLKAQGTVPEYVRLVMKFAAECCFRSATHMMQV